jgi:hypothetical protein
MEPPRGSGSGLDFFQGVPQPLEITLLRVGHRVDGFYCRLAQRSPEFEWTRRGKLRKARESKVLAGARPPHGFP